MIMIQDRYYIQNYDSEYYNYLYSYNYIFQFICIQFEKLHAFFSLDS